MSTTLDSAGHRIRPRPERCRLRRGPSVHNGLVARRPGLIVRCRTTNDVVAAVNLARRAGPEISVRGGGHNVAGRAVTEGG
jgi:FAD/FMN-containing dehydrogenase